MEKHSNLDILRAFAVLLVLAVHFMQAAARAPLGTRQVWGLDTDSLGRLGVLLFFVHTALVLMQSIERSRKDGVRMFVDFYVRRAFRIYPLAIFLIVAAVALEIPPNALGTPYEWLEWRWLVYNFSSCRTSSAPIVYLPRCGASRLKSRCTLRCRLSTAF